MIKLTDILKECECGKHLKDSSEPEYGKCSKCRSNMSYDDASDSVVCTRCKKNKVDENDTEAAIQRSILRNSSLSPEERAYHQKKLQQSGEEPETFWAKVKTKLDKEKQPGQNETAPPGWEKSVKGMKKHKNIDNPWALAWWMKKKGAHPKKEAKDTDVFDKHQTKIAKKTLKMPDAMVGVMGGPDKKQSAEYLKKKNKKMKYQHQQLLDRL